VSKTISNKKGRQRVAPARSKVKYGFWRRQRMQLAALKKQQDEEEKDA